MITEEQYRQIMDTLKVKSASKDYNPLFLAEAFSINGMETKLYPLRASYNHFISKMLESYKVPTHRIYDEFDYIWNLAYRIYTLKDKDFIFKAARVIDFIFGGPVAKQILLKTVWDTYKERVEYMVHQRVYLSTPIFGGLSNEMIDELIKTNKSEDYH